MAAPTQNAASGCSIIWIPSWRPTCPPVVRYTATRPSIAETTSEQSNNGAPITSYNASCTSTNGGATKSQTGASSPITVSALTAGKTYRCKVTATNSRGTGPPSQPGAAVAA
jgi:hypothetical protein